MGDVHKARRWLALQNGSLQHRCVKIAAAKIGGERNRLHGLGGLVFCRILRRKSIFNGHLWVLKDRFFPGFCPKKCPFKRKLAPVFSGLGQQTGQIFFKKTKPLRRPASPKADNQPNHDILTEINFTIDGLDLLELFGKNRNLPVISSSPLHHHFARQQPQNYGRQKGRPARQGKARNDYRHLREHEQLPVQTVEDMLSARTLRPIASRTATRRALSCTGGKGRRFAQKP